MTKMIGNTQLQWYTQIGEFDSIQRDENSITLTKPLGAGFDNALIVYLRLDEHAGLLIGEVLIGNETLFQTNQVRLDEDEYPWEQVIKDVFDKIGQFGRVLQGIREYSQLTTKGDSYESTR